MSVVPFERTACGRAKPFARYPAQSAVFLRTHDLTTVRAFWEGRDIELCVQLGLLMAEEVPGQVRHRKKEVALLAELFGVATETAHADWIGFLSHVLEKMRSAPCALTVHMLDDVLGERSPLNVPGTISGYPNWRTRYPLEYQDLSDLKFPARSDR